MKTGIPHVSLEIINCVGNVFPFVVEPDGPENRVSHSTSLTKE